MSSTGWISADPRPGPGRIAVAAVLGPGLVTLLALFERRPPTTAAALLYVLVVVVAAGSGGALAGVAASVLSFLALNFFFTPPLHTFVVGKAEDLIALIVFLLVSVITGLLLSAVIREKARAETREAQTRMLNDFTSRLLSGRPLEDVLVALCKSLLRLLDLARCEITTVQTQPVEARNDLPPGATFEAELIAKGGTVGVLRLAPPATRRKLDGAEQAVIRNVAGQLSLALESTRLTDEIRRTQIDAETNRLRAALFSGVTHDLKTPLAAITTSVTSLIESSHVGREELYEQLDTIRHEAEHLDRLLTNLMDLARLRAGALVPARVPASIDEVIEAVVTRLQPLLNGRELYLNLRGDLPEMAIDVIQIDQLLTNLVENAIKFTPPGSPIELSAVGDPDHVRVTVADRGPGIASADRERVLQPFERGDGEVAGTGLGLAIAHAVVLAHGGRMWVQDHPGGGAAITFELPTRPEGASD